MAEDGKVIYKVKIDDSGVESEAEAAGQKAGDGVERGARGGTGLFKEAMIGAARAIGEAFVQMAAKAVQGVEQIAKAGIDFNAKMETYQTAFTTLLGSAEEADKVMAQIRQDAASTPFDVDSLTKANQMLISAGVSADEARNDVLNLANAIAATGGGSDELSRMAANMQQIQNTGKATAMDIRQFANAGINIYGLLADSMGITTEQAAEMDVTYEQLAVAFAQAAEEGGVYENALENQSKTFTGRVSTLKDNATQLAGALTEDLFSRLSNTALPMVMDFVAQLLNAAETGGISGALQAAETIIVSLINQFIEGFPAMAQTGINLILSLVNGIADRIPYIMEVGATLLFLLIDAIGSNIGEIITAGINLILALVQGLVKSIPLLIAQAPIIIKNIVTSLIQSAPQLLSAAVQLIMALATGLIESIPLLLGSLPQIFKAIIEAFKQTDWSSLGTEIINGLIAGLNAGWQWLQQTVSNLVQAVFNTAKRLLGISSPSKKFKWIGEMTGEGFEEGIEDTEQDITRTVTTLYSSVGDTAENAMVSGYGGRGGMEQSVSYALQATGTTGGTTIVVPLSIDGREIARATAWTMGEQLAWEEM